MHASFRTAVILAAIAVSLVSAPGQQQQAAAKMERVSLEDGSGAPTWNVAEASASISDKHAGPDGRSLLLHIEVDHFAGQPKYPIGWPRMNREIPEHLRDWSSFDFLELVIHTQTSRDSLPVSPLGLILYTPDKANAYHRTLTELEKGKTTRIVIPTSKIPRCNDVTRIQFFISESNYRHGDVLDFYIDDIALTRYVTPTVSEVGLLHSIAYDDTTHLGVSFRLLGVEAGEKAQVRCRIRQGDRVLGDSGWRLDRGQHEVWLEMFSPPKPGLAVVEISLDRFQAACKVRFISSPFALAREGH